MSNEFLKPGWMKGEAEAVRRELEERPDWIGHISEIPRNYSAEESQEEAFETDWMGREAARVKEEIKNRPIWLGNIAKVRIEYEESSNSYSQN